MLWRCDLVPQYEEYKSEIDEAIQKVLISGRYTLGKNVIEFEKKFSNYVNCEYGVGVNSGTDALILALQCFDIRPGDEVITTPFTAIPTYAAIRHVGATPIFVDIDPDTFLIDLEKIKASITSKTKAIVPVHIFGNVVDIEKLRNIIGPDIYILEDCAQSTGATIRGRKAGSMGDISAFSFYPTKNLGAYGDGGMVLTNNPNFDDIARKRRMYGMLNKDEFIMDGINTRLDELQAAILNVKLNYLDSMNLIRNKKVQLYKKLLNENYYTFQLIQEDVFSVHHVLCVKVEGLSRDGLTHYLNDKRIESNIYYPMPLNEQVGYKKYFSRQFDLPNCVELTKKIIALPLYPEIENTKIEKVCSYLNSYINI
jgi:dTDP-4-amino-4,6-dideoxygalactose transaminase